MKTAKHLLTLCCLSAIVAGAALAQPSGDKKDQPKTPKTTAKPGMDQPKGEKPAGMPSADEMMKMCEEASRPTEMNAFLVQGAGVWEGKCKFWMDPSNEKPEESNCTSIVTPMMGDRFTKVEVKGSMKMGEKTMPFEGFGICGFNTETKQFEQTWIDNMGTMQMHSTGKLSDDKKTLTWEAKFVCPMMHQETWMRQVEKHPTADTMVLEMWGPDPSNNKPEYKMMEISYTRKAGTAPKMNKDNAPAGKPLSGH